MVTVSSHSTHLEGNVFCSLHLLAWCRWEVSVVKYKEGLGPKQNIPLYAREKVSVGAAGR